MTLQPDSQPLLSATAGHEEVSHGQLPSVNLSGRPGGTIQSEERGMQEGMAIGDNSRTRGTIGDQVGQTVPPGAKSNQELDELRQWLAKAKEMEELALLRRIKRSYEAGDFSAIQATATGQDGTIHIKSSTSRPNLPRPEAPHQYQRKNRQDYNMWERDCEGYFARQPSEFVTEQQKIDFGIMYVSEPLKTLWSTYMASQLLNNPLWEPDWANLKQRMLNALGTPAERQQAAFEAIKACRQRDNQTPTELLHHLQSLWAEMDDQNPRRQAMEYQAALKESIYHDLLLMPLRDRMTLMDIEEQANVIYRRQGLHRQRKSDKNFQKHQRDTGNDGGDEKTPKTAKKGRFRGAFGKKPQSGAKDGQLAITPTNVSEKANIKVDKTPTCYSCGKPGHLARNCHKSKAKDNKPAEKESGKEVGQKS